MSQPARSGQPPAARGSLVALPSPGDARTGYLRRAAEFGLAPTGTLAHAGLAVDVDGYGVRSDGRPVSLSPRQVELLALFVAAPGRVWSREQLHWVCWGEPGASRRVDVQLCRIRGKLGVPLFRNVRERGWMLAG